MAPKRKRGSPTRLKGKGKGGGKLKALLILKEMMGATRKKNIKNTAIPNSPSLNLPITIALLLKEIKGDTLITH